MTRAECVLRLAGSKQKRFCGKSVRRVRPTVDNKGIFCFEIIF